MTGGTAHSKILEALRPRSSFVNIQLNIEESRGIVFSFLYGVRTFLEKHNLTLVLSICQVQFHMGLARFAWPNCYRPHRAYRVYPNIMLLGLSGPRINQSFFAGTPDRESPSGADGGIAGPPRVPQWPRKKRGLLPGRLTFWEFSRIGVGLAKISQWPRKSLA